MSISIVKVRNSVGTEQSTLAIDGVPLDPDAVFVLMDKDGGRASVYGESNVDALLSHQPWELPVELTRIGLGIAYDWSAIVIAVSLEHPVQEADWYLQFEYEIDTDSWKHPYTVSEFSAEHTRAVREGGPQGVGWRDVAGEYQRGGVLTCGPVSATMSLWDEIGKWEEVAYGVHEVVLQRLAEFSRQDTLVTAFDFPMEIRAPCEQYLLYFGQFLRDLGIPARTHIREEAGQVLFGVTPQDGREALHRVREALGIYLELAELGDLRTGQGVMELPVQQLLANIHHLRSQLHLQSAVLQAKDTTIEAQRALLAYQEQLLGGRVLTSGVQGPAGAQQDSETILGGTVAITRLSGKGYEINLPEIFRRLRARLGASNRDQPAGPHGETRPSAELRYRSKPHDSQ